MKSNVTKRNRKQRHGTAAVEFSLLAPIVFSFFVSIIVFAQANLIRDTAQHACYEAARSAIVPDASIDDAAAAATTILNTVGAKKVSVTFDPEAISPTTPEITAIIQIPLKENLWIAAPFIPDDWSINQRMTLRREITSGN